MTGAVGESETATMSQLHSLDMPKKVLLTMFLVVLSAGFLVAHLYLHHTMAQAGGGKSWIPSSKEVAKYFYGNPDSSRLTSQVLGPMKKYFSQNDDSDHLDAAEQADLDALLAWEKAGAPADEY